MKERAGFRELLILAIFVVCLSPANAGETCQYALFADATSELLGHEAKYAIGAPDSDLDCGTAPIDHASWEKQSWNLSAQIVFSFNEPVYPEGLRIYGDYDLCINKIWFLRGDDWYLVGKGVDERGVGRNCTVRYDYGELDFKTSKIKVQPCAWAWSAIDAVQFCGSSESFPKITPVSPAQDAIIGSSSGNLKIRVSTDIASECEFSFSSGFDFGEGQKMETLEGRIHSYAMDKPAKMGEVSVYYKCRGKSGKENPYSVMHRFSFRDSSAPFIQICNWQNCSEGAASISDDDGYHMTLGRAEAVCSSELEKRGLKGTYFLAYTDKYNESDWELFRRVYEYGHEIGGHSRYHLCRYDLNETFFREDKELNRQDIIGGIGMPPEDLITFAWPCGVTNSRYKLWLSDYYLFARGYYKNVMGSKNPVDMMEFKSINSIGFGQLPPDYYLLADTAENHQEWINYVYHDSCDNPEIFDYLLDKGLWVDTIGSVSKYIVQRNSAGIENVVRGEGRMEFDVVSPLDTRIFDKELTLMIYTGNEAWGDVIVNGKPTQVTRAIKGGRDYFLFNIPPGNAVHVEVIGLSPDTPLCGDGKVNLGREECDDGNENDGDGCSSKCKIEGENRIYILSYVGNIDGTADKSWYYFFDNITAYYEKNQIPVAFSFFPESMKPNNYEFSEVFRRMYLAENIELMQKGYRMDEYEKHLETLDPKVQKYIIEAGRHTYLNRMKAILGKDPEEISFPTTYVAPYGRMSPSIRKALEEMGFRVSFGVYYVDELGPVESTANTDMYQYAVSFTQDGSAGRNTTFKTSDEIIAQVLSYDRADLPMVKINGKKVIPLYVHQPDFEHPENNSVVDEEKWKIYTETIERLYNNPNVTFITPSDAWALRHPVCIPTGFSEKECNWIDDDCDGRIDEECDPHSYLYNFSYSEYGLGYDEDKFGPEYFRDYFRKGSIMDRMSIFVYAIYDWAFYSTKGVRDRF